MMHSSLIPTGRAASLRSSVYACASSASGACRPDVAIPVMTNPGEIAQVDFGYVGKLYDPEAGILRRNLGLRDGAGL